MDSKKWYESKTILMAILMGASGIVVAFSTQFPTVGWLIVLKAVLDIVNRFATSLPIQ